MKPALKNQLPNKRPIFFGKTGLKTGFTLVELLVIISILAILSTIAFLSFSSQTSKARDSTRITDISSVRKGLEIYQAKSGYYPMPDSDPVIGILTGTLNGVEIAYKGIIADSISRKINISKIPSDPLNGSQNYIYGITQDKKKYQIATILENTLNMGYINNVYANDLQAKVDGNYEGNMKFGEGCNSYLTNIPSLIYNYSGAILSSGVDFSSNKDNVYFVVDEELNMPYNIGGNGNTKVKNIDRIIKDIYDDEQVSFTGINLCSIDKTNYTDTFTGSVLSSFGGEIEKIEEVLFGNNTPTLQEEIPPPTGTFTLSSTSVTQGTNVTISNNCSTPPTSYTSSNTAVATIAGTTITTLSAGTTNIAPVGGACGDIASKVLNVIIPVPSTPIASAATSITTTSITWNWQAASGATYYEWSKDGITWTNKGTGLSHTETGLTCGTIYTNRQVKACNAVGCSGITALASRYSGGTNYCRAKALCEYYNGSFSTRTARLSRHSTATYCGTHPPCGTDYRRLKAIVEYTCY